MKPLSEFHCYRRHEVLKPQSKCKECAAKRIKLWRKQSGYTYAERKRREGLRKSKRGRQQGRKLRPSSPRR